MKRSMAHAWRTIQANRRMPQKPNWTTFSGSGRMTAEIQILPKKTLVGKRFLQDFRFS
jgi:hypothetical protein